MRHDRAYFERKESAEKVTEYLITKGFEKDGFGHYHKSLLMLRVSDLTQSWTFGFSLVSLCNGDWLTANKGKWDWLKHGTALESCGLGGSWRRAHDRIPEGHIEGLPMNIYLEYLQLRRIVPVLQKIGKL
jgi:hypothetical protein